MDMFHVRFKILAGKSHQLVDKIVHLRRRNVAGEQKTVDDQMQFAVLEIFRQPYARHCRCRFGLARLCVFDLAIRAFQELDVVAHVYEVVDVAANRLAVGGHVVLGKQDIADFLLREMATRGCECFFGLVMQPAPGCLA